MKDVLNDFEHLLVTGEPRVTKHQFNKKLDVARKASLAKHDQTIGGVVLDR